MSNGRSTVGAVERAKKSLVSSSDSKKV